MLVQAHCFPNAFRPCWAVPWYWSWASRRKWKKCWGTQWPRSSLVPFQPSKSLGEPPPTINLGVLTCFFHPGLTFDEIWIISMGRWTKKMFPEKKRKSGLGRCKTSIEDWENVAVWIGQGANLSQYSPWLARGFPWFPCIRQSFASPHHQFIAFIAEVPFGN